MERFWRLRELGKFFKARHEPKALTPQPEPEGHRDEDALLAPPGTYDKLRSLIRESESGSATIGKFNFKRYLSLSTPKSDMIMLYHKVRTGTSLRSYTSWNIHILDSDKVVVFDNEHSESGPKPATQDNLNEVLAEVDKTIKTRKLFRY